MLFIVTLKGLFDIVITSALILNELVPPTKFDVIHY